MSNLLYGEGNNNGNCGSNGDGSSGDGGNNLVCKNTY